MLLRRYAVVSIVICSLIAAVFAPCLFAQDQHQAPAPPTGLSATTDCSPPTPPTPPSPPTPPPPPYTLTITSGNNQRVARTGSEAPGGIAVFNAISVTLNDLSGNPMTNKGVVFACPDGPVLDCQLTPGGPIDATVTANTNVNGVATLNQMGGYSANAYYADGTLPMTASYGGITVHFNMVVDPNAGSNPNVASIVSGNNQTVTRTGNTSYNMTASFAPLEILVTNKSGNPAANASVGFLCVQQNFSCNFPNVFPATTDSNGHFTISGLTAMYATGGLTVQFVGATFSAINFNLNAVDPPLTWVTGAQLTVVSGNNQSVARTGTQVPGGIATFGPISVKVTAPDGTPVVGGQVTFQCQVSGNMACQLTPGGGDYGTVWMMTDSNGTAELNAVNGSMDIYYAAGAFTMKVSYGSIASTTLHFTVTQ